MYLNVGALLAFFIAYQNYDCFFIGPYYPIRKH